jgi:putative chitinase
MYQFDRDLFFEGYGQEFEVATPAIQDSLEYLLDQIEPDVTNWENLNQIAYALATFKWETANTFQPIYERGPVSYFKKYEPGTPIGKRLGNTMPGDGYLYRGRGYVQLTGRANYTRDGQLLGIDLVGDPDKALQPGVAYQIASRGMHEGWFTGHRLAQHIATGSAPDYINARRIINGLDHAPEIAATARKFEQILTNADITGVPGEDDVQS